MLFMFTQWGCQECYFQMEFVLHIINGSELVSQF